MRTAECLRLFEIHSLLEPEFKAGGFYNMPPNLLIRVVFNTEMDTTITPPQTQFVHVIDGTPYNWHSWSWQTPRTTHYQITAPPPVTSFLMQIYQQAGGLLSALGVEIKTQGPFNMNNPLPDIE